MNSAHTAVLVLVTAAALVLAVPAASAQPKAFEDPLLERLAGAWVLRGTIGGQATTHDVTADWVLGHEYLRLREVSREKDAAGRPAYEAIVFIGQDPGSDGYACLWLDSTGGGGLAGQSIGHAKRAADAIAFVFKGSDGSLFHTTFACDKAADAWQWLMDGEEGGKLVPFARLRLTKK
jgi:hypothetical protein